MSIVTPDPTAEPINNTITVPLTDGLTSKVIKGTLWTLAGQAAPAAVSLVTTPLVIRKLGAEGYGILILVGLIPTYFAFADFGMGLASTKFGSMAYAYGDREMEARNVWTAAVISLFASVPIAAILFVFSSTIISLFSVPEILRAEATTALRFASVMFVVNFLCGIFNTPQLTRMRMDLNTFVNAGFRILGLLAVPLVLYFDGGIATVTFVLLIVSVFTLGGHLIVSGGLLRELFDSKIEVANIRSMLKFGGGLVVAGIASIALGNAEKGVLAAAVSASALAYYSVAFMLAGMMLVFAAAMIQSLLPAFSQLQSPEKRNQLMVLYSRGIRLSLFCAIPALVIFFLTAKPFFTRWAGEDYGAESTLPFYILLCGVAFNIIGYFPHTAIMAAGRTDIFARLYWIEFVLYSFTVWILVTRYGTVGAAIAWSVRVVVDTFIQFIFARLYAGVLFSDIRWMAFSVISGIMLIPLVAYLLFDLSLSFSAAITIPCLCIYSTVMLRTLLENEEIVWMRRVFSSGLRTIGLRIGTYR